MTVNSFTSVSLDLPLVLVCIDRNATIRPKLEAAQAFGINVLKLKISEIYQLTFPAAELTGFETTPWFAGELGVPLIDGALAHYECETERIIDGGDHLIFIAEVRHLQCFSGRPLLYYASGYETLP